VRGGGSSDCLSLKGARWGKEGGLVHNTGWRKGWGTQRHGRDAWRRGPGADARGQVAATAGRLRRAWVGWRGAWDQRRRGGPDAWVAIGEHGPAQMNSILCELFKNIQTSLNGFDPKADFPCSNNWLGRAGSQPGCGLYEQ
jgi:hypothetical protein